MKIFDWLFNPLKGLRGRVEEINALEAEIKDLSEENLKRESQNLREEILANKKTLDEALPMAFALIRETAKRNLKQRHFDTQLIGGIVLHQGKIAEMATGEGKTLSATAPVYLNALAGNGVHVVTVNEYLAKRDAVWMGQIYNSLGLAVACLIHDGALIYDPSFIAKDAEKLIDKERDTTGSFRVQDEYLRPISRKDAYLADITYGTNHEFGFDYLRDNLSHTKEGQVQSRGHHFAIVDEVDSILIDEARTPLIISAPDSESSDYYKVFARQASMLVKDEDYTVDEKFRSVDILESGIDKVEKSLKIDNIYAPEHLRLTHYLEESLKAHTLFKKDKDYVVKPAPTGASGNNEIIIVDQNTGRLMMGRRYSGGLHQAIEAKEGVRVQQESRTYAQITIQNYFRLYRKLAGMTGTAQTSAEEFDKVYGLHVVSIPSNKPIIRKNVPDVVYKTSAAKFEAVANDVKERQKKGQPVLIGTISIEKNEQLSNYLNKAGIRHEILNAKNNEREGEIIAQAGKAGAVTLATNMAGRGVDIILGGNPPDILGSEKVKGLGGLHVIGTERHDARRIDNQLRGRSGRQGDPGSSQFFLSLEDDLMRIFGGDRIKSLMETLNVSEDTPIESGMISKVVSQAQGKVEGFNFDARKHLLEYDDILNKQRLAIYEKRQAFLENQESGIKNQESETHNSLFIIPNSALSTVLGTLDLLWMNHLEAMEALRESVRLRAYGQHDPLVEYRREGHMLFRQLLTDFDKWLTENASHFQNNESRIMNNEPKPKSHNSSFAIHNSNQKVGRNDPCPCGAKRSDGRPIKYKHCHGK